MHLIFLLPRIDCLLQYLLWAYMFYTSYMVFSIGTIPLPLCVHPSELTQRSLTVTPTSSFLGGHDFASSAEKLVILYGGQ